jgi:hypothetical protein
VAYRVRSHRDHRRDHRSGVLGDVAGHLLGRQLARLVVGAGDVAKVELLAPAGIPLRATGLQGWAGQTARPGIQEGCTMTKASVSFAGNLTDDPEVRYTENGIARAMFRVAVSGRREQEASFFTVIVWRDQAEHVADSLSKGSRVVVVGRLQQRSGMTDSESKWDSSK